MYRAVRRLRLPYKLIHASERDTPRVQAERARYHGLSATLDLRRLKFIDESGINIAMTRSTAERRGVRGRWAAPHRTTART